jgi:GDP-L-fucose synthase
VRREIWITGGTGFFGRHVAAVLGDRACATGKSEVDLLDFGAVREFARRGQFRTIVHAAGFVGGVQLMAANQDRMYEENVRMGQHVIQAAAEQGLRLLLIGSAACYSQAAPIPTAEEWLFEGEVDENSRGYAEAKRRLLAMAGEVEGQKGYSYCCLVPATMYGPGLALEPSRSNVIAGLTLRALESARSGSADLEVWGTGEDTRDFLFVEDAVEAAERALERWHPREAFNIGSGRETPIRDLAGMVAKEAGFAGELVFRPSGSATVSRRVLEVEKAGRDLGFRARTSLGDGLKKTVAWIRRQWESGKA